MKKSSKIDHPTHYNAGGIEVIDMIEAQGWGTGFCLGNAVKYLCRAEHKGQYADDLSKAEWYINRLLKKAGTND